ncbi:MAG: glutathione S-transferase family protein, partial [Myxococcaceae bacterium]|nr:glutathione S-transferase family protein [Myxococcaceae bacterium]
MTALSKIVLHQFPVIPGTPSASPFCVKVHWALHLKELEYETRDTLFAKRVNPSGRLPAIHVDGVLHEDSTRILELLDGMVSKNPLYPSEPRARALTQLLEDWADETLYWYVIYARWVDDEGFAKMKVPFFASLPALLRLIAPYFGRRTVLVRANANGIAHRTKDEVLSAFEAELVKLDALLGEQPFLMGDALTAADI